MFGLRKTLSSLFVKAKIDDAWYESLEETLLLGDVGIKATQHLIAQLKQKVRELKLSDTNQLNDVLTDLIAQMLAPLERHSNPLIHPLGQSSPKVWLIVGVNGAGKTTTIGKLCHQFKSFGQSVLLGAGDTFRAAAKEQLLTWGQRNDVAVITQQSGDSAAIAHDAVAAGTARSMNHIIIDTAGRLSTQANLMDELKKVKRVISKVVPDAPHEIILVLDGNTGQNGLSQVKSFHEALELTGIIITKLDGTAKGGVLCAIAHEFATSNHKPSILALGMGERLEDLKAFSAQEFAQSLIPSHK